MTDTHPDDLEKTSEPLTDPPMIEDISGIPLYHTPFRSCDLLRSVTTPVKLDLLQHLNPGNGLKIPPLKQMM